MHMLGTGEAVLTGEPYVDIIATLNEFQALVFAVEAFYDLTVRTPLIDGMATGDEARKAVAELASLRSDINNIANALGMEPATVPGFED